MSNSHYNKKSKSSKKSYREPTWKWVFDSMSENKKAERRAAVRDGTWRKKK